MKAVKRIVSNNKENKSGGKSTVGYSTVLFPHFTVLHCTFPPLLEFSAAQQNTAEFSSPKKAFTRVS